MPKESILEITSHTPEERSLLCSTSTHLQNQCLACAKVTTADQHGRDASDALERALREKSEARNQRNSHHSYISRLPTEIACRIFSLCFATIPTPDQFYRTEFFFHHQQNAVYRQQLVLGAVCQDWRHTIWSNPSFWRFISLRVTPTTPADSHSVVAREWLDCSRGLPLVILVSARRHFGQSHVYQALGLLMEILNSVAARWECIALRIPTFYINKLRSPKPSPIKAMTLYPLDDRPIEEMDQRPSTLLGFGNANPSHLRLKGCHIRNLRILWHNVTRFMGFPVLVADVLKMMERSPSMEECELHVVIKAGESLSLRPMIIHDSLRILEVLGAIEPLLSSLSCPSLQKLVMHLFSCESVLESESVHQFVIRSTHSLTTLSLISMGDPELREGLIRVLFLIPSLEDLSLSNTMESDLFERLGESAFVQNCSRHSQLLPNLRTFTFIGDRSFPWASILTMVPLDPPSPAHTVHRPLSKIQITIDYVLSEIEGREMAEKAIRSDVIEWCDLKRMVDIQQEGIDFLLSADDGTDLLEFWMNIYGKDKTISATGSETAL